MLTHIGARKNFGHYSLSDVVVVVVAAVVVVVIIIIIIIIRLTAK